MIRTPIAVLIVLTTLLVTPVAVHLGTSAPDYGPSRLEATAATPDATPSLTPELGSAGPIEAGSVKKTLTLEAKNTVVLRGPVTTDSVSQIMLQLRKLSRNLPASTPLYLVLDTPGGSVLDGMELIDFVKALPQKVHTVTLFAASMGFQIAQNLDTRYITRTGVLMSHRATLNGLGGQIKGELETRYKLVRRIIDFIDAQAAKRMGIELTEYEKMIVNEYWVYGFDAVKERAADESVYVRCGASLEGSEMVKFSTLFGDLQVEFSKCPLVKGPIGIDASRVFRNKHYVTKVFMMSVQDKRKFIKEYIVTDKFFEVFQ